LLPAVPRFFKSLLVGVATTTAEDAGEFDMNEVALYWSGYDNEPSDRLDRAAKACRPMNEVALYQGGYDNLTIFLACEVAIDIGWLLDQ
jgi:hypothetical protein